MAENEQKQTLADLLEKMGKQATELTMSLHTVGANQVASNMNAISFNSHQFNTISSASGLSGGSVTFFPNDTPVIRMSRAGFWLVGDHEISTVSLLLLVEEFFKKQDRIANPPKFDTPEAAQEWLDSVS